MRNGASSPQTRRSKNAQRSIISPNEAFSKCATKHHLPKRGVLKMNQAHFGEEGSIISSDSSSS
eukprot:6179474-Pleurochrysis_carterae.AAC.5